MGLGRPLTATWEKQVREGLEKSPWKLFFRRNGAAPEVSVRSFKSRLFVPKHVRALVLEAFEAFKGALPDQNLSSEMISSSASPGISVELEDDSMRLYVDAGGPALNMSGFERFEKSSRLNITEIIAAGVYERSVSRILNRLTVPSVIWDPFSGAAVLPLTLAKCIGGVPAGSPSVSYPFRSFPFHNKGVFSEEMNALDLDIHPNAKLISDLYISDSSVEAVEVATKNYEIFKSSLPEVEEGSVIPFDIHISRLPDAYTPPAGNLVIITALPASDDAARRFKRFHSMVKDLMTQNRLSGCVIITNKPDLFRKLSSAEWLTELRISDGRRDIEALSLVVPS